MKKERILVTKFVIVRYEFVDYQTISGLKYTLKAYLGKACGYKSDEYISLREDFYEATLFNNRKDAEEYLIKYVNSDSYDEFDGYSLPFIIEEILEIVEK